MAKRAVKLDVFKREWFYYIDHKVSILLEVTYHVGAVVLRGDRTKELYKLFEG